MREEVPKQWLTPEIKRRLRDFTGKFLRVSSTSNKKAKTHRLDVQTTKTYFVHIPEAKLEEWPAFKQEINNSLPKRHIQITFYREDGGIYSATTGVLEWNNTIPQNSDIVHESEHWFALVNLVKETDPDAQMLFSLASGGVSHVKVRLLRDVPRPAGNLVEQRVRDNSQAVPSHPYLKVEWTPQGFLPKNQPKALEGDCLPRAVMLALKPEWDKNVSSRSKMFPEPLSIPFITRFCKCDPEMSLQELQPFLEHYKVSLHVLDTQGKRIFTFKPPLRNKHLNASSIYLLLHNNHATLLNHSLKALTQLDLEETYHAPSKHFSMLKMDGAPIVIQEFADLKDHIIHATDYTRVYYAGDMNDAFARMAKELNLEANLKFDRWNTITELRLHHPNVSILHLNLSLSLLKPLRDAIFLPHFHSHYSSSLQRAFCDLPRGHLKRNFASSNEPFPFIDIVRSYTANLKELESIPVFSQLDDLVPYDNHPLEPYSFYVIKKQDTLESWFIANSDYNLVSGLVLQRCGLPFTPVAFVRPSSVMPNTIKETLKTLYKDFTNPDLKTAVNLVLGMAGKRFNKNHWGRFTTDPREAFHFSNDVQEYLYGFLAKRESVSVELVDGFYPLYFMIYDLQRLRLLETFRALSQHTKVLGVHTDGFFVEHAPTLFYHEGPKTWDDLGKLQLENPKKLPAMPWWFAESRTKLPPIVQRPPYNQVSAVMSNTFVDADIAGAGKTHAALQFLTPQSLIVIQSDKQVMAMEKRTTATIVTYATLLGHRYEGNKLTGFGKPYDLHKHDHILLDELFQIPVQDYEKCLVLLKNKSVIGTGDTFQTSTGVSYNNFANRRQFYEETLWKLFPNRLTLKHSHRLEDPEDEKLILEMRQRLQAGVPIRSLIHCFPQTKTLTAFKTHIPYTNLCAQILERQFGDNPDRLVFNDYDKKKSTILKMDLPIHQDAEGIHYVEHNGKRLQYLRRGSLYPVKYLSIKGINMVKVGTELYNRCRFKGEHANTGHSLQGDTLDHPFAILEWNHPCATWEWFYTAITRCVRLSDVHIYTGPSLTSGTHKHIHEKLASYKETDEQKGHEFNLNPKWVQDTLKAQNFCCQICSGLLELEYERGDTKQWSVDRRDNGLGHLQSNCRIVHLSCNQSVAP